MTILMDGSTIAGFPLIHAQTFQTCSDTLIDKVCQCIAQVGGFRRVLTNPTARHDIVEILLKVALNATIPSSLFLV